MKHVFLSLIFSIILFSCKKDKDPEPDYNNNNPVKEFKVSSTKYSIQNTLIRHSGYGGSSYLQKLTFLSSEFHLQFLNDTVESVTGTGNGVTINFYTGSDNPITGTFSYSSSGLETTNTFEYASYGIGYDVSGGTGINRNLNQGTLTITDKGSNIFEVTITGKDTDNNDFILSYTGILTPYKYDDEYF